MTTESNKTKPRRIAAIGGAFDPPTFSHLMIGAEIFNLNMADEIWYIPCGSRDDKLLTNSEIRVEMLTKAIDEYFWNNRERVKVNDIE